jgi:hypothetical protein
VDFKYTYILSKFFICKNFAFSHNFILNLIYVFIHSFKYCLGNTELIAGDIKVKEMVLSCTVIILWIAKIKQTEFRWSNQKWLFWVYILFKLSVKEGVGTGISRVWKNTP